MHGWRVTVNERLVRKLLRESRAVFPNILVVPPDDPELLPGPGLRGQFSPGRGGGVLTSPEIRLVDAPDQPVWGVRSTLIHELRHWWQHADGILRRKLVLRRLCLLGLCYCLLGVAWFLWLLLATPTAVSAIVLFFLSFLCLHAFGLLAGLDCFLDSRPRDTLIREADAESFARLHVFDPRWVRAIKIEKVKP